jgi:hypothetical protein
MPKAGWRKHGRDPALLERDLQRYRERNPQRFPGFVRQPPELTRGEIRFATEVLLAVMTGAVLPTPILSRAIEIASEMANG